MGADPGVTPATIVVGGTAPLSEAAAASARGAAAFFKDVNARGGVNGRTIVYRLLDDAGDPLEATRRLVEDEGVFALVGSVGAEQTLTVRDYLNGSRVPQLFVGSGATALGRDHTRYPWTIGFRPSHRAEGWIYGAYLARARRGTAVGVLFADDEEGRELLAGLRQGVARSTVRVVAAAPVAADEFDLGAQVAALQAAGANVLAVFARAQAEASRAAAGLGWRPQVLLASSGEVGVEGAVSLAYAKDPADASWRDDPAMRRYRSIMTRYLRGANAADSRHVEGMAAAYEFVRVLRAAGTEPSRARVTAAVRRLNDASNPFLLPGVVVRTGANERFPVGQAQLRRWSKGRWRSFGGLWAHPGS